MIYLTRKTEKAPFGRKPGGEIVRFQCRISQILRKYQKPKTSNYLYRKTLRNSQPLVVFIVHEISKDRCDLGGAVDDRHYLHLGAAAWGLRFILLYLT